MNEIFHTDLPNIMHEMIDNEVVVVNLDNGTYYSFDGVGGQIWALLGAEGASVVGMTDAVSARYAGEAEQIASAVSRFIEQLRDEGLVRVGSGDGAVVSSVNDSAEREAFEEPALQKYTDMEALLLADPIHEVDDAGWPHLK